MESYLITMGISIVLNLLKSESSRRKYKSALLKLRNAISAAFPDEVSE